MGNNFRSVGTPNAIRPYAIRDGGVLHRDAIIAVDKITDFGDADVTIANEAGTQGSLSAGAVDYVTAIPGNKYGSCKVNANLDTVTITSNGVNTHVVQLTIAQATGAEWYDLFLSTAAAPLLVGRITEAQRAAGGFEILTVGTVTVNAGVAAGKVNIGVVGTGQASSAFSANNAYTPDGIDPIGCAGFSRAHIFVKVVLTDLRTAPTLVLVPFLKCIGDANYYAATAQAMLMLTAAGQPLYQDFWLDVDGAEGLKILIGTMAGQDAAVTIRVELM